MPLIKDYDRMLIDYKVGPCFNNCAFCHSGDEYKRVSLVPFAKVKSIAEKLIKWKEANAPANFKMFIVSGTWDHQDTVEAIKLEKRVRNSAVGNGVMLGGMKHRSEPEMREWLTTVKEAGAGWVGMTFWGPRELHDAWCGGRRGEYDFAMMSARLAAEIGLPRTETLFLTKSTLPHLDAVMDILDAIPGPRERCILPLNYGGRAIKLEHERLTKEEFVALPDRVLKYFARTRDMRTEGEWMEYISSEWDESQMAKVLRMAIDKANVDQLASMSAADIMESLMSKYDRVYASIPNFRKMSEIYGDPSNNKIYSLGDVETRWSQRYYQDHPRVELPELKKTPLLTLKTVPKN